MTNSSFWKKMRTKIIKTYPWLKPKIKKKSFVYFSNLPFTPKIKKKYYCQLNSSKALRIPMNRLTMEFQQQSWFIPQTVCKNARHSHSPIEIILIHRNHIKLCDFCITLDLLCFKKVADVFVGPWKNFIFTELFRRPWPVRGSALYRSLSPLFDREIRALWDFFFLLEILLLLIFLSI